MQFILIVDDMSNDSYIDDSYLQAQSEQEEQEYQYWLFEQEYLLEQVNKELQIEGKNHGQYRY